MQRGLYDRPRGRVGRTCTRMRLAQTHVCPALRNLEPIAYGVNGIEAYVCNRGRCDAYGHSLYCIRLQPLLHTVTASIAYVVKRWSEA